jgi:hypothetical protein
MTRIFQKSLSKNLATNLVEKIPKGCLQSLHRVAGCTKNARAGVSGGSGVG